jgi:hypothetical protein
MRYLCLVYHDHEATPLPASEPDAPRLTPLGPAAAVRIRDGLPDITDGPFRKPTEPLCGYLLIDARDLNEAIRIAIELPQARFGGVEVWPVHEPCSPPSPRMHARC